MMPVPDLLLLRLDALEFDLAKVRAAVDLAKERGRFLEEAIGHISPCKPRLTAVQSHLSDLLTAMSVDLDIAAGIGDVQWELDESLKKDPDSISWVVKSVEKTIECLHRAVETAVPLKERSDALTSSLNTRWTELSQKVIVLRADVKKGSPLDRREQWVEYHGLLNDQARPMFAEYVDFLGGLTVRDTGMDDRVCEMTDALLTRYKKVTKRSLPLPARQAALGSVLDSVVLLGFPEWSIWGIPLVGHEVGLAYAQEYDPRVAELVRRYMVEDSADGDGIGRTEPYMQDLLADAFATFTLGLSYGCAAILLRLSPRHDEAIDRNRPRDIERARLIKLILTAHSAGPKAGGSYTDAVGQLSKIWDAAVRAHARPAEQEAALAEAAGPPAELDWLDDFSTDAVRHFESVMLIRPYNNERWKASGAWHDSLLSSDLPSPSWNPTEDAVVDVLTAAWRLRLADGGQAGSLANDIKSRWSANQKGV